MFESVLNKLKNAYERRLPDYKAMSDLELYNAAKPYLTDDSCGLTELEDKPKVFALILEMASRWYRDNGALSGALIGGEEIWYVEFEEARIDHGTVCTVSYKDGVLDSVGIDFDYDEFDEIVGKSLGKRLFKSENAAKLALHNWQRMQNETSET